MRGKRDDEISAKTIKLSVNYVYVQIFILAVLGLYIYFTVILQKLHSKLKFFNFIQDEKW